MFDASPASSSSSVPTRSVLAAVLLASGAMSALASADDGPLAELVTSIRTVDSFARSGPVIDDPPLASREEPGPFNINFTGNALFTDTIDGCVAVVIAFGDGQMSSTLGDAQFAATGSMFAFRECSCGITAEALGRSTFDITWNVLRPARVWYRTVATQDPGDSAHEVRLETADGVEIIENDSGPAVIAARVLEPGQVRVFGGSQAETGGGCGSFSDEAEYEFDFRIVQLADLDADGIVGASDLLMVLEQWGPCPEPGSGSCLADVQGDGVVDTLD
ncbi:MAG: hypothetical protein AB8G96_09050, partial [Phycisphaerales bacterium]